MTKGSETTLQGSWVAEYNGRLSSPTWDWTKMATALFVTKVLFIFQHNIQLTYFNQ